MLCVNFLIWDIEWVWSFLFGLCLIYTIASTNNNKQNQSSLWIFPSDSLIKKIQHTHKLNIITKNQNQNIHKRVQNLRIKKKNYTREPRT